VCLSIILSGYLKSRNHKYWVVCSYFPSFTICIFLTLPLLSVLTLLTSSNQADRGLAYRYSGLVLRRNSSYWEGGWIPPRLTSMPVWGFAQLTLLPPSPYTACCPCVCHPPSYPPLNIPANFTWSLFSKIYTDYYINAYYMLQPLPWAL
jgi:hypothetical protein